MYVIIAGGSRTGSRLGQILLEKNHTVQLIENKPIVLEKLHKEMPTENIKEGVPIDPEILEQAGIQKADVIAAVTSSDEQNLNLCFMARAKYNVPRTIARVNNPYAAWLFDGKFHVDSVVNHSEIMSHLIEEEMSMGDMITLLKLRRGKYSLVENKILHGSQVIGKAIKDLALPENCIFAGIIRQGEIILPRGITILKEGDEILAITDSMGTSQLAAFLTPPGNHHS